MKPLLLSAVCVALVSSGCGAEERAALFSGKPARAATLVAAASPAALQTTSGGGGSPASAALAGGPTNAPAAHGETVAEIPPPQPPPELPAPAAQVVQLAQSTLGEQVLVDYVATVDEPYELHVEHVIYLHDLGVPDKVIEALLKRQVALGGTTEPEAQEEPEAELAATPPATNAVPVIALTNAPGSDVRQAQAPSPVTGTEAIPNAPVYGEDAAQQPATVVAQPQQVNYQVFYNSLAPYGTWVEVADYGWCWQPTVAVINTSWRPYSDNGRWVWTNQGWYWNSYYSWGWAPFHYGRWAHVGARGWCWVPGTHWGPSWVSWRHHDGYLGWAPLPPACGWSSGIGLTWYGSRVSVGFSFGLSARDYCFVPAARFYDPHCYRYRVGGGRHTEVYQRSQVVNNYVNINGDRNTVIINNGVSRDLVQRYTRQEIRPVALADSRRPASGSALSTGRLPGREERLAVYRPPIATGSTVEAGHKNSIRPPQTVLARQEVRSRPAATPSNPAASQLNSGSGAASRPNVVPSRPGSAGSSRPSSPAATPTVPSRVEPRTSAPVNADNGRATIIRPSRPTVQVPRNAPVNTQPQRPGNDVFSGAVRGQGGQSVAELHGRGEARPVPLVGQTGSRTPGASVPARPSVGTRPEVRQPVTAYPGNTTRPQLQVPPVTRFEQTRPLPQNQVNDRRAFPTTRPQAPSYTPPVTTVRPSIQQQPAYSRPQTTYTRPQPTFSAPVQSRPTYTPPARVESRPAPQYSAPRSVPQQVPAARRAPQAVPARPGGDSSRGSR